MLKLPRENGEGYSTITLYIKIDYIQRGQIMFLLKINAYQKIVKNYSASPKTQHFFGEDK